MIRANVHGPKGRLIIAQQFTAGTAIASICTTSPIGTAKIGHPRLNRPYGTNSIGRLSLPSDKSLGYFHTTLRVEKTYRPAESTHTMWNLNDVTELEYQSEYRYRVVFDDGVNAVVDSSEYLDGGPVFAPLRDIDFFRQARIEGGTIAWPNGAYIAPETLYEKCWRTASIHV